MALNTPENRQRLINAFNGALADDEGFYIESPCTYSYNCIAWAMGFDDRWVDYVQDSPKKWWPKSVEMGYLPENLVNAFEAVGFVKCDDDEYEEGYDKVALYQKSPFYEGYSQTWQPIGWTHAARVITPQKYHSKAGPMFDIYHLGGSYFENTIYGEIYQFMKRKISGRAIVEEIKKQEALIQMPDMAALMALLQSSGIKF